MPTNENMISVKSVVNMKTNDEIIYKHRDSIIAIKEKPLGYLDIHSMLLLRMLDEVRADSLRFAIAHMRVARSSMCLKDRAILLNEINWLETELKKIEE